ncbi:hypothetical protein I5M27_14145 [Adhaeribacter sp. BT258]|uniref:Uncharacterized protein n=1 Tax=Adhaeribacter terrigena TaxID=2793070 RepID=A0ABS1C450_9BACT|nr:hypothetical protein [Adhaeribacter terrigena]MBK0404132.1 hypothetical protein [Adhaeribacter terrigena]
MKKILVYCAVAAFSFSCSENKRLEMKDTTRTDKNGNTTSEKTTNITTGSAPKTAENTASRISFTNMRTHIFSDPAKPDTFRIVMQGSDILNGKAHFTITTAQGKVIHNEIIPAPDLEASMVYELETPTATKKQREDFIKNRFSQFFHEEQFTTPAIAPNDVYDPTFGDETAWNAIKKDPKSISFSYLLGKENGKRIAYSKLKKKVMLVGNFGG